MLASDQPLFGKENLLTQNAEPLDLLLDRKLHHRANSNRANIQKELLLKYLRLLLMVYSARNFPARPCIKLIYIYQVNIS